MVTDLTRPIAGIENRTAQEVFDIMCDRLKASFGNEEAPRYTTIRLREEVRKAEERGRRYEREAALSTDAEPVAYRVRMVGQVWQLRHVIHEFEKWEIVEPLYAAPPAPSVAVKALEWTTPHPSTTYPEWRAFGLGFEAVIDKSKPLSFGEFPLRINGRYNKGKFNTLSEAKAAAQADYEARIRSALSAQVQDVAGWQSIDSAPKDGSEFVAGRRIPSSNEFTVHTYKWDANHNYWNCKRHGICIRPEYQDDFVWYPLPAAPAAKQAAP